MNHIKRTQIERDAGIVFNTHLSSNLNDLKVYLCSDKFRIDTTVQVSDVLRRLDQAVGCAEDDSANYLNAEIQKERSKEELVKSRGKANCEQCGYFGYAWGDFQVITVAGLHDPAGYPARLCSKCYSAAKRRGDIIEP